MLKTDDARVLGLNASPNAVSSIANVRKTRRAVVFAGAASGRPFLELCFERRAAQQRRRSLVVLRIALGEGSTSR